MTDLQFWQCEPKLESVASEVEGEVYAAIRDLLADPPSPDFLLDWIWPSVREEDGAPADGWGIALHVDGKGRPEIRRFINAADLIREDLDSDSGRDGVLYLTEKEERRYRLLAYRLRESAQEIDAALQGVKRPQRKDVA